MVGNRALSVDPADVGAWILTFVSDARLFNGTIRMNLALVRAARVGIAEEAMLALADTVVAVASGQCVGCAARVRVARILGLRNKLA